MADRFFRDNLPKRLLKDFFDLKMFSEADMEASAYHWTRRDYLDDADNFTVHRQYRFTSSGGDLKIPDLVVVNQRLGRATEVAELKFLVGDRYSDAALENDLAKAKEYRRRFPSVHTFYQIYMYGATKDEDGDPVKKLRAWPRQDWMKNYLCEIEINVEFTEAGSRRRPRGESFDVFWDGWQGQRDRIRENLSSR